MWHLTAIVRRPPPRWVWVVCLIGALSAASPIALAQSAPVRDDSRRFAKSVASWKTLQRRNIVMQSRDYSCGAAALATIVRYYLGDNADEQTFLVILDQLLTAEEAEDRIENGLAMSDLRRAAVQAGYQSVVAKMTLSKLLAAKAPLIVGIDVDGYKHFVVLRGFDGFWVYLADPIRGNIRIHATEFQDQWQGHLALAVAKPGQKPNQASRLALTADDLFLGQTNRLLIQRQATRGSIHESRQTRN